MLTTARYKLKLFMIYQYKNIINIILCPVYDEPKYILYCRRDVA